MGEWEEKREERRERTTGGQDVGASRDERPVRQRIEPGRASLAGMADALSRGAPQDDRAIDTGTSASSQTSSSGASTGSAPKDATGMYNAVSSACALTVSAKSARERAAAKPSLVAVHRRLLELQPVAVRHLAGVVGKDDVSLARFEQARDVVHRWVCAIDEGKEIALTAFVSCFNGGLPSIRAVVAAEQSAASGGEGAAGGHPIQRWAQANRAQGTVEAAANQALEQRSGGAPVDAGLASSVARHTGVDVSSTRVHTDSAAQQANDAMGARAFASGNDVFLGRGESAADPRLMGHELAHVAQQQQGGASGPQRKEVGGGAGGSLEAHADAVGDKVAADQADHVDGAPPLAKSAGATYPVFAQSGKPYMIVSAKDPVQFWIVNAWIRAGAGFKPNGTQGQSPACATEILTALGWVTPDHIRSAANHLSFDLSRPVAQVTMAASAFAYTGMPSGKPIVSRVGTELVQVSTQLANPDVPPHTIVKLDDDQRLDVIRALAGFTGLQAADDALAKLHANPAFQSRMVEAGVLLWNIDAKTGDEIFGAAPDTKHGGRYSQWLHAKQDAKPANQADNPKLKLSNYYGQPIPGEIVVDRDLVEAGTPVWIQIPVKWPATYPSADEYDVAPMVTPGYGGNVSLLTCAWSIKSTDGSGVEEVTSDTQVGELHQVFTLPKGRESGTFKITVHASFPEYFEPKTIEKIITVKSTAAAMDQLGGKAFADLGAKDVQRTPETFDVRGSGDDKEGSRTSGQLPPSFVASSLDTTDLRSDARLAERKRLEAARMYMQAHGAQKDVLDAIDRELAASRATEAELQSDHKRGFQPFQIRGTYLSRTDGVPSGALMLYGSVRTSEFRMAKGGFLPGGIVVQIRDLSRCFDNADMMTTGVGATFEEALKAAFLDNAKQYPTGVIEIEAEAIDAEVTDGKGEVGKPNGRTLGFQLGTDSTWRRVKQHVFSPIANLATNLAAMALMAFVPGSATVVAPLLIAYNTAPTVDRLRTEAERGTLSFGTVALSVGEIALNLLPLAGKAKPFTKGWWALETANWGGQAILMGASARQAAMELQAQDAEQLAGLYEEMQQLEASGADPAAVEAKRQQVMERAKKVSDRIDEQITDQVGRFALLAVAGSVIHRAGTAAQRASLIDKIVAHQSGAASVPAVPTDPPAGGIVDPTATTSAPRVVNAPGHEDARGSESAAPHAPTEHPAVKTPSPTEHPAVKTPSSDKTSGVHADAREPNAAPDASHHSGEPTVTRPVDVHPAPQESIQSSPPLGAGLGAEIARQVPATSYKLGGVFETTIGDHEVAVSIRRTSGKARIIDEAHGVVLEIPKGLDKEGLKAAVVEQLLKVRETERAKQVTEKAVDSEATAEKKGKDDATTAATSKSGLIEEPKKDPEKTREDDQHQLKKPDEESLEEANARRSQSLKPKTGSAEAWASPQNRHGIPEEVPLTRQELRDVVTAKYGKTLEKYLKGEHTANPEYLLLMRRMEAEPPGFAQTREGKKRLAVYIEEQDRIAAKSGDAEAATELRSLYNVVEKEDMRTVWAPKLKDLPLEQQAKLLSMYREELKLFVREMMPDTNCSEILMLRDRGKYGDRRGGRFDEFVEKGLNSPKKQEVTLEKATPQQKEAAYQKVIESSMRSDEDFNLRTTGTKDGIDPEVGKQIHANTNDVATELPKVKAANVDAIAAEKVEIARGVAKTKQEGNETRRKEVHLGGDKPAKIATHEGLRGEFDELDKLRSELKNAKTDDEKAASAEKIKQKKAALDAKLADPTQKEAFLDPSVSFALQREAATGDHSDTLKKFLSNNIEGVLASQKQSRQGVDPELRAKREIFERELALRVLTDGPIKKAVDDNLDHMCQKALSYLEKTRTANEMDGALSGLGLEAKDGYAGAVLPDKGDSKTMTNAENLEQTKREGNIMRDVLTSGNARERMIALGKFAELVAQDMIQDPTKMAKATRPAREGKVAPGEFTAEDAKRYQERMAAYLKDKGHRLGDALPTPKDPTKDPLAEFTKDFLKPTKDEKAGSQKAYQDAKSQDMDTKLPSVEVDDTSATFEGAPKKQTGAGENSSLARTSMTVKEAQAMGYQLSEREIAAAGGSDGKLPWIAGTIANTVDPTKKFIQTATEKSLPQKAGISGTTFRFMEAATLLGGKPSESRLAMIGALQVIDAHTVYEIASAAQGFGLPYNPERPYEGLGISRTILEGIAKSTGTTLDELNGQGPTPGPKKDEAK